MISEEVICKDWLARAVADVERTLHVSKLAVVFDDNTYTVLAQALIEVLKPQIQVVPVGLGRKPKAEVGQALAIRDKAKDCDAILAVGSGTINDLCKYAAYRGEIPYAVCATAPSMNGYVSATASLTNQKRKYSLQAQAPRAVFADLEVLMNAPARLIRAGIGDVLCRATAQSDWLLSHLLFDTPYDAVLYKRLLPLERELLSQSRQLQERDATFIRLLMRMLNTSGQAMADAGSSAPASQGEHMIVHCYELLYSDAGGPETFHGEQVAVATLTMAHLQEKLLLRQPKLRAAEESVDKFVRIFGREEGEGLYHLYQRKAISFEEAQEINERLPSLWPEIRAGIEAVRVPAVKLENALRSANCPLKHSDLQWPKERYEHAVTSAHLTRDRFTFLDLAAMDKMQRIKV